MRFGVREVIFLVLLLAMPIAAYMFVFKPRNIQIAEARQQINQKKSKLDRLAAATKNINDLGNGDNVVWRPIPYRYVVSGPSRFMS